MSRSYKHIPCCGDRKNKQAIKRIENKRYRSKIIRLGIDDAIFPSMHKRCFESWKIYDYYGISTFRECLIIIRNQHGWRKGVYDEIEEIHIWRKLFLWK